MAQLSLRGWARLALRIALLTAAGQACAHADDLKPGDVLDKSNWQKAEKLLPPEILKHYQNGDYANPIVDWDQTKFVWPKDFVEASSKNEGRYGIGENGEVIDKATGKQPAFLFGFPFPKIDPQDAHAAQQILWNFFYRTWYFGTLRVMSQVNLVNAHALERRTDQNVHFLYYDGVPEKERLPNPQNFSLQQLIVVKSPTDLNGTAALSWRYRDPTKRDNVWSFVPALRRVRAVSPANRSDGFLGSDMNQDDGPFFDGKVEDFTWTLKGESEALRFVDPINLNGGGEHHIWMPGAGGWRINWPDLKTLGYMDSNWTGVAWAPISGALAKRPFYIIEGVPKDKYYLFGRLELYVDKETFQGAWNRKFAWSGELLNSFQVMAFIPRADPRPDGAIDYNQGSTMAFQCVENIKRNQATAAGIKSSPTAEFDVRAPLDAQLFDMNSLSRYGK
ncbi:MAG: outer membrane lipoprotein-sorting protein [Deltaproteobacteria bacterium]|nr:outer membrane lipoprotein-sorting protein [Deltaproteobacteria bacterium]